MTRRLSMYAVMVAVLALFCGLVAYGWTNRYGGGDIQPPGSAPVVRVGLVERSLELTTASLSDECWGRLPSTRVPLMHQATQPPWSHSHVSHVTVRAFHNARDIYFLLEWDDPQADGLGGLGRFGDACAIALPVKGEPPAQAIMMGFSSLVSFWQWKADLDARLFDAARPEPAYSDYHYPFEERDVLPVTTPEVATAVLDQLASRPGSLTQKERQLVRGRGHWADGKWRVIIMRAMTTDDPEQDPQLKPGRHSAAFAVWAGQDKDRGARKSISDWVTLEIAPAENRPAQVSAAPTPSPEPASEPALPDEQPRVINVLAKRFEFIPSQITLHRGELVTLRLQSLDVTHGLYLDGYDINIKAPPGEVGKATFRADRPGRFSFRCAETCGEFHPYMIGYLSVTPNSPFLWFALAAGLSALSVAAIVLVRASRHPKEATPDVQPN